MPKKPLITGLIGFSLALGFPLALHLPGPAEPAALLRPSGPPVALTVSLYPNDSIADLSWGGQAIAPPVPGDTLPEALYEFDVFPGMPGCLQMVWDGRLYQQRWDTLAQPRFWRRVMTMGKDSCLVNIANTREVVAAMATWQWEAMPDSVQEAYRDSVRRVRGLPPGAAIYVTAGKRHYYKFGKVLPSIGRGVRAFEAAGVDPWYAQAILLIESPGQLVYSPVGAYGSFQLMEEVALEQGLVVNDSIDEREDFDKAARAAAGLIAERCLPQTRHILRKRGITFDETDIWFRLLVLHAYHAGAGNVEEVMKVIEPREGGIALMQRVWQTEAAGFKNASQNYSQVALASLMELDQLLASLPDTVCRDSSFMHFATTPADTSRPDSLTPLATTAP